MSEPFDCDSAREVANEVYSLSEQCLMAHSIRAVEKYLLEKYAFPTQIILEISDNVVSDMDRLSWCSPAQNKGDKTFIFVDREWGDQDQRRFCVAHELYHIIWSVASVTPPDRSRNGEEVCDIYANRLCELHNEFNTDTAKRASLIFTKIPYRSV